MKKGGIVNNSEPFNLSGGERVIPTRQEILYFDIMKTKKVFRPIKVRTKFTAVLDEIKHTLPMIDN